MNKLHFDGKSMSRMGSTIFEKKDKLCFDGKSICKSCLFFCAQFFFSKVLSVVFSDRKYIKEDIVFGRIDIRLVQIAKHFHFKIRKNPLTYNTVFSMEPT